MEPEHRFVWYLCSRIYHTTPDDPQILEMDPVQKLWMYQNWLADQNDQAELAKNHAYLLASFSNPEAVKEILGANVHSSSEAEFEESARMVKEFNKNLEEQEQTPHRRKRRTFKE